MAATLAATFTLIRCVRQSLYGDIWNLVQSVRVGETLVSRGQTAIFLQRPVKYRGLTMRFSESLRGRFKEI